MTDKQAFERVEEILKEITEIAKEKKVRIDAYSNEKGDFAKAGIGDYDIVIINEDIRREYVPKYRAIDWRYIDSDQVNFSGEPHKESAPGGNPNAHK